MPESSVLVIGATGFVGSGVARALKRAGHRAAGLARSAASAQVLRTAGLGVIEGDLTDLTRLKGIARQFDVCVFAPMIPYEDEEAIIDALLDGCRGSSRALVFTSGTGVLARPAPAGEWDETSFAEDDDFTPPPWLAMRVIVENKVRAAAAGGTRTFVIRPPMVWGHGGSKQIPAFFESVRLTGDACYFGAGLNMYSNVHVDDLSCIYALALEKGRPGALYHAVSGETNFRSIAEAVAQVTICNTRSVDYDTACGIWGEFHVRFGMSVNSRSRATRTRSELGWRPRHVDLVEDIRSGSYRSVYASGRAIP